jgi:hypothetical protein
MAAVPDQNSIFDIRYSIFDIQYSLPLAWDRRYEFSWTVLFWKPDTS